MRDDEMVIGWIMTYALALLLTQHTERELQRKKELEARDSVLEARHQEQQKKLNVSQSVTL